MRTTPTPTAPTASLAELARKHNLPYTTLRYRVRRAGWPLAKALTTPVQRRAQTQLEAGVKRCTSCDTVKPLSEFYRLKRRSGNQFQSVCKACNQTRTKGNRERLRWEVIAFYSNDTMQCTHCGEDRFPVLDLDRIHRDDTVHRVIPSGGTRYWQAALKERDVIRYRVLCRNCNWLAARAEHTDGEEATEPS